MYLEERVEQLETLSVDHGRQIETVAKGLANLTVTVNQRFDEVNQRFDNVDQRFNDVNQRFDGISQQFITIDQRFDQVDHRFVAIDQRFDQVNQRFNAIDQQLDAVSQRFDQVEIDVAILKDGQIRLESTVLSIQQTQHTILTILQERLK